MAKNGESRLISIQAQYQQVSGWSEWMPCSELIEGDALIDSINELQEGDYVEVASLGGSGNYVMLAKLVGATNRTVTDIYGDPSYVKTSLLGNYSIGFTNVPDPTCSGWICSASYSDVVIQQLGVTLADSRLVPGQTFSYQAETCNITVTFHSGEVYNPDPRYEGFVGRQTTSDFTIHLTTDNLSPEKAATTAVIIGTAITVVTVIVVAVWLLFRDKGKPSLP